MRRSIAICWLSAALILLSQRAVAQSGTIVNFETEDGIRIFGEFSAPPKSADPAPMVILLHMNRSDHTAWKPLLAPLHQAGFAVLAIDFRGHGQSGSAAFAQRVADRDESIYREMWLDVRAAYDWLAQQPGVDRSRLALVGASVGCSVALRYAGKDRSVDAIVALSPGLRYLGLDSAADVELIKGRRMLMIASAPEQSAAQQLARLATGATVSIGGDGHGTDLLTPQLGRKIADFIKQSVGAPARDPVYASIERDIYHKDGSGWLPRINATNLRVFSSAQEAESRGLRRSKSNAPGDKGASRPDPQKPGTPRSDAPRKP